MIVAIPVVIDVYIVALLAVVIVPKADSAPISVAKIVRKAVVIVRMAVVNAIAHPLAGTKYSSRIVHIVRMAVVIVRMAVVNAIVHPLAGTKYSIKMTTKNCKG